MRVPPNPLALALDAASQGPEAARRLAAMLPRAARILDAADLVLERVDSILDGLEECVDRIQVVVERVASSERVARAVVDDTALLRDRVTVTLDEVEPVVQSWRGTAAYAGRQVGNEQVDAFVAYLEFLPMLQKVDQELVPMMATLNTVAPDLTQLLAVSKGLNELLGSLPGLGRVKKRVDDEIADDVEDSRERITSRS